MIDFRNPLRLYLVADPEQCDGDLTDRVESAVRGGVTLVQLRAKCLSDRDLLILAEKIKAICAHSNVPFLVNDRIDIALACGADGVHLGGDDLPVDSARSIAGGRFVIGYSPETENEVRASADRGADYLGIGPVFATTTKADAGEAIGIQRFASLVAISELPVVGIGGISTANYRAVLATGAAGIAVVTAILGSDDTTATARQLSRN